MNEDHLILIASLFFQTFFAILFLQSGLDKVLDWKGNLGWLTGHFEKSPLAKMVPALLGTLTLLEVLTGLLSVAGLAGLLIWQNPILAIVALMLAAVSLLCLFFGQRMAKDYAGAAGIVPYFIANGLALYLVAMLLVMVD
ncbi:MAG: DoxX family protein [Bacteroidia bacterium]|nr:DoxX family protein [Bacteroidia bacterium]